MLSTDDYIELISSGVDAGMVSLVEGAYRCMFEATASESIPVRPVDYPAIARHLGIDVSDCMSDGEPDPRAVERKVAGSVEFGKLKDFVDKAMDLGIDYSGLGYRDDTGVVKYIYPELAGNPSVRNALSNLKSSLLVSVSGTPGFDPDSTGMSEALGRRIGSMLYKKFSYVVDRYAREPATELDDVSSDDIGEKAYVSGRSNVEWTFKGRPGTDGRRLESSRGTEINLDPEGRADSVLVDDNEFVEWRDALECIAFGPVNGISESMVEYCEKEYLPDTWVNVIKQVSTGTLVGILRKSPGMYGIIVKGVKEADHTDLYGMLRDIELVVKAYDGGDLDDEGVADIVEHASDPAYVAEKYGPDIMGYISSVLGAAGNFDTRPLSGVPDLPEAVTGKKPEAPGGSMSSAGAYFFGGDDDFEEKFDHAIGTPAGIGLLSSPDVQWKIFRNRGIDSLTAMCTGLAHNIGYCVPIDSRIMRMVFRSSNRAQGQMNDLIQLYANYVYLLMSSSNWYRRSIAKVSARNVERIMDDVRQYITPRVQRELYGYENGTDNGVFDIETLETFVRWVPGFRLDPALAAKSGLFASSDAAAHHMPTSAVIAFLRKELSSDYRTIDSEELVNKTTSPEVLDDIYHKTPSGLRIIEIMTRMLASGSVLNQVFERLGTLVYAGDDGMATAEEFLNSYVVPKRAVLADTVTSIMRLQVSEMAGGHNYYSGFGAGMIGIMDKLRESNGKKPSVASMLFLARGSWLDFKTRAWDNPALAFDGKCWLLNELDMYENDEGFRLLATTALAGQNLLHDIGRKNIPLELRANLMKMLFSVDDRLYRKTPEGPRVISDEEFTEMIGDNPKMLLVVMDELSPERKKEAEAICFTPEFMDSLAGTLDGMRLLLELGKVSGLKGFSEQFIIAHKNKIAEALDLMSELGEDEKEIAELRNTMFGTARKLQQEGGKISDELLGRVEYSVANGLRWMTGYVKLDSGLDGVDGKSTLFSHEGAMDYLDSLGPNSPWRLPTVAELRNLGGAETISKLGLGFTATGKGDSDGEFNDIYDSACYAWYCDNGRFGGYSVSYDMINIDDSDIEEGDYLAIKLVSRA